LVPIDANRLSGVAGPVDAGDPGRAGGTGAADTGRTTMAPSTTPTTPRTGSIRPVRGLPVLGNLLEFRRDRLGLFQRIAQEQGDLGSYTIGRERFLFVNSPELVHEILVTRQNEFDKTRRFRTFARPLLGNGLLSSDNETNRKYRKVIAPAMRPGTIERHVGTMTDRSERLSAEWADGDTLDVQREMVRLTLWIVGKSLFDLDVLDEADELGGALTAAIHGFNAQASAAVPLTIEWPTPVNLGYRRAIRRLEETFYRVLEQRRADPAPHDDWLDLLLRARDEDGQPLPDQQIRDEALNLFMPGHETTATGLTWTWYLLAQHPEAYRRLTDEVDAVLGGRTPDAADLRRLPYAMQCFKEAMRLYPPVYMFSRAPLADVDLAGVRIPAGTPVIFSPYTMHRRPDLYPDPEVFDPDRFTPEAEAALPRHAYQPFGSGRRICVGNHYGLLNGQAVLATVAQRVRFSGPADGVPVLDPMVTLRPRDPMLLTVHRR
jgi:cytochrome P450